MGELSKVGVLVNTCDRFEDCWELYFHQWKKYSNGLDWPLYLNTEWKDYQFPEGIKGYALAVCKARPDYAGWSKEGIPTWSWCVEHALNLMPEDFVLYMQDDYFLTRELDTKVLNEVVSIMEKESDIDCVYLNKNANGIHKEAVYSNWKRVSRKDSYFVSCQAAIWRKSALLQLLRTHESAWQFERWGTRRARALRYHLYMAAEANYSPVEYFCTGIVQGMWLHPVEDLFYEANIKMDFSRRGFWSESYRSRKAGGNLLLRAIRKVWERRKSIVDYIFCCLFGKQRPPYPEIPGQETPIAPEQQSKE